MGQAERTAAPLIPEQVVQHIFGIMWWNSSDGDTVLALKERVRALAVCRTWKACLDPKLWPIHSLCLNGGVEAHRRIARWMCTTQPALECLALDTFQPALLLKTLSSVAPHTTLTELSLEGEASLLVDALPAVCRFTRLKDLNLSTDEYLPGKEVDLAELQSLLALEHLTCCGRGRVKLRAGTVLPQLTRLLVGIEGGIELDAALPCLQQLDISAPHVRLGGEHLQLPQLSKLSLEEVHQLTVDWPAMPQLAELSVIPDLNAEGEVTVTGLAALASLTSLGLFDDGRTGWRMCHSLLQAAPPSVHHLRLGNLTETQQDSWAVTRLQQLRRLTCGSLDVIVSLGSLTQLQQLDFPCNSVRHLTLEHLDSLCRLTTLRRLEFGGAVLERDHERRVEVVRKVLPAECTLVQVMRH